MSICSYEFCSYYAMHVASTPGGNYHALQSTVKELFSEMKLPGYLAPRRGNKMPADSCHLEGRGSCPLIKDVERVHL
jgi:hypothetical protein